MTTLASLHIKATDTTPEVRLDAQSGVLEIKGRSLPENAVEFYNPILAWMDSYIKSSPTKTTVNIDLDYLNSISEKIVVEFLKAARSLVDQGHTVEVNWYYDEEDEKMMDEGRNLAMEHQLHFHLHVRKENE